MNYDRIYRWLEHEARFHVRSPDYMRAIEETKLIVSAWQFIKEELPEFHSDTFTRGIATPEEEED